MIASAIAIDPGYAKRGKGCALAWAHYGVIKDVWYQRDTSSAVHMLPHVDLVIWEKPQVDARTRSSTPAVVELAAVGGELAGYYAGMHGCKLLAVAPKEWKGSVSKPVCHARVWQKLSDTERARLGGEDTEREIQAAVRKGGLDRWSKAGATYYPSGFDLHNILDAVAIALWAVGR